MELIRISRDVYIDLDATEAIVREPIEGTEKNPRYRYVLHLSSGKEFITEGDVIVSQISAAIAQGEADDAFTPEKPRTLTEKLVSLFRR